MTKNQRRDKESSAERHRNKSTEDYRPSEGGRERLRLLAGVNLARRCLRRKVTIKARITRSFFPVVRALECPSFLY